MNFYEIFKKISEKYSTTLREKKIIIKKGKEGLCNEI